MRYAGLRLVADYRGTKENVLDVKKLFFLFVALGNPRTDREVHINLEELLELQHQRDPVSYLRQFKTDFIKILDSLSVRTQCYNQFDLKRCFLDYLYVGDEFRKKKV